MEYTDIYDSRFNNTLKMIVKFIDDNNLVNETYDMKYYKKLSSVLKCEVSDFESRWTAD